jgi:hypothetical protein
MLTLQLKVQDKYFLFYKQDELTHDENLFFCSFQLFLLYTQCQEQNKYMFPRSRYTICYRFNARRSKLLSNFHNAVFVYETQKFPKFRPPRTIESSRYRGACQAALVHRNIKSKHNQLYASYITIGSLFMLLPTTMQEMVQRLGPSSLQRSVIHVLPAKERNEFPCCNNVRMFCLNRFQCFVLD